MIPLLHAYVAMMPVLKAQESLQRSLEIAIGAGTTKRGFTQRTLRDWRRDARRFTVRSKPIKPTKEQHHAMLGSLGIAVKNDG